MPRQIMTSSSGLSYGNGLTSTVLDTLVIAVLAPIATASEVSATKVSPRVRKDCLKADRKSMMILVIAV
jgi:hypothetical protein